MLPYGDSRLTRIVLSVFFLLVIIYAYYEARGFLYGPSINIPSDVTVAHDPFVTIRGTADRIAGLYMNGKPVPVTEGGGFRRAVSPRHRIQPHRAPGTRQVRTGAGAGH